jgi:hypothetical protein
MDGTLIVANRNQANSIAMDGTLVVENRNQANSIAINESLVVENRNQPLPVYSRSLFVVETIVAESLVTFDGSSSIVDNNNQADSVAIDPTLIVENISQATQMQSPNVMRDVFGTRAGSRVTITSIPSPNVFRWIDYEGHIAELSYVGRKLAWIKAEYSKPVNEKTYTAEELLVEANKLVEWIDRDLNWVTPLSWRAQRILESEEDQN